MSSGGPALAEETLAFLRESFQLFSVYLEESGDLFYDVDTSSSEEGLASSDEDEDDDDEWNSSEEEGLEHFLQNMSLLHHVVGMPPPRRRRKRNVPCKFYLMGNCRNGDQCDFQHNVAVPPSAADTPPSSSSPQRAGPHPPLRSGGATTTTTTTSARQHHINVPCKFFANSQCRNGENCRFSHAAVGSSAVSSSSTDKEDNLRECAICYETVETFGLLENCDHCFCLPCIRTWRSSAKPEEDEHPFFSDTPSASTVRVCPMCRQTSYLVVPSKVWPRDAAHKANIQQVYRERLGAIPCKYFSNVQFCPFGEHCLYQHLEVKD